MYYVFKLFSFMQRYVRVNGRNAKGECCTYLRAKAWYSKCTYVVILPSRLTCFLHDANSITKVKGIVF